MSFAKTDEPIEMPFGVVPCVRWGGGKLAPTSKYDATICAAAAMRADATVTLGTCYYRFYYSFAS